jgi:hypothetical protein
MKIYINNLNLNILNVLINNNKFISFLIKHTENYIELFTDFGIYQINNKSIYLLEPVDKEISKHNNYYNKLSLIVDPSYFKKQITYCINGDNHFSIQIKREFYKINSNSKIKLVIESRLINNEYNPNDIYFECENEISINDLFIKQELIEFLSILN